MAKFEIKAVSKEKEGKVVYNHRFGGYIEPDFIDLNETEKIIAQAKLNKELKGLKVGKKKNNTDCPFCEIEKKLIKLDEFSGRVWSTCYDTEGNKSIGLEEQLPRCPKCNAFLGAKQTEFKGFYNDNGKISKKDIHIHLCPKCDWKSKEYNGTFISRD